MFRATPAALAAAAALLCAPAASAETTLLHAGRLIDGRSDQARTEVSVVVVDGRIARVSDGYVELDGADRVLNPYRVGGMRLALTAIKPTVTDFIDESLLGSSVELELAEVVIDPSSELAGKTLAGAEVRKRFGIIVVALKRGDKAIFNPDAQEKIEGGDVLVALGPLSAIERVEKAVQ